MLRLIKMKNFGALAQLARAPRWQRGGQRFESVMLHNRPPKLKLGRVFYT